MEADGTARNRASAAVQPIAHGQRASRWSVTRRAERVSRRVGDEGVIPAMKDAFQPDRPTRIVARPGQGLWTGHHPNGQAGMTMDLESDVISGRPCDSPGCALSADP
jgi:hypothetical protein